MQEEIHSNLWPCSFQEAVCRTFKIAPEAYVSKVFWKALYLHARPVAWIIHRLHPDFFREDFSVILELGQVRDPAIFTTELNYFFGRNRRDKRWLRTGLAIRVSAKRLIKLKNSVLGHA